MVHNESNRAKAQAQNKRNNDSDFIKGTIAKQEQQSPSTEQEHTERRKWLQEQGVQQMASSISISTREKLEQDISDGLTPDYLTYAKLQWYAESSERSHRLEQLAAFALRELGLDASVVPVTIDGQELANKRADVIVRHEGFTFAVEVKENKREYLGLPIDESDRLGLHGYSRYPKSLWADSVSSYDAKVRYHWKQKQLLMGVIVLCSISELSDEDSTCYGLLWLHGERSEWRKQTCHNPYKGTTYAAYKTANAKQVQPLISIRESLAAGVELMQSQGGAYVEDNCLALAKL